jgi:hypothetical protein
MGGDAMTKAQGEKVIATVRGLFPTATPEQTALVAEKIAAMDFGRALAAVKNHNLSHAYLNVPALMDGLRAAAAQAEQRRVERQGRVVDWIRRNLTQASDLSHEIHGDDQVVEKYYASCWRAVRDDPTIDDFGREWTRGAIYGHVVNAAIEAGVRDADAITIAESAVELPSGGAVELPREILGGKVGASR